MMSFPLSDFNSLSRSRQNFSVLFGLFAVIPMCRSQQLMSTMQFFFQIRFVDGLSILCNRFCSPFLSFLNGENANPVGDDFPHDCSQVFLDCEVLYVMLIAPIEEK